MTIIALKNFGHKGENIAKGSVLDVDTAEFGDTFQDFVIGGFLQDHAEWLAQQGREKNGFTTEASLPDVPLLPATVVPPADEASATSLVMASEPANDDMEEPVGFHRFAN